MQKNITSLGSLNWDDLKFFLEVARTRKASAKEVAAKVDLDTTKTETAEKATVTYTATTVEEVPTWVRHTPVHK